jgi:hypothetical protein
LDLEGEIVNLAKTDNIEIGRLAREVPTDAARYHLFWYKHTHEGDYTESAGLTSIFHIFSVFLNCVEFCVQEKD